MNKRTVKLIISVIALLLAVAFLLIALYILLVETKWNEQNAPAYTATVERLEIKTTGEATIAQIYTAEHAAYLLLPEAQCTEGHLLLLQQLSRGDTITFRLRGNDAMEPETDLFHEIIALETGDAVIFTLHDFNAAHLDALMPAVIAAFACTAALLVLALLLLHSRRPHGR